MFGLMKSNSSDSLIMIKLGMKGGIIRTTKNRGVRRERGGRRRGERGGGSFIFF
jgi:hypothetical protein